MPFPASISLGAVNEADGFRIPGLAQFDLAGSSVASAGDINGDGIDDLIIGVQQADPNGSTSGAVYVVFGRNTQTDGGFAGDFSPADLNGLNGFRIRGVAAGDNTGRSVSSAGDINGDGIDDIVIGAFGADPNGNNSGSAFVVFGRDTATAGAFASDLELSALDGSNGFRLDGGTSSSRAGFSVASAGDINGDGVDDLVVGAPYAQQNGVFTGAAYVVFGRNTATVGNFGSVTNLTTLNGADGFQITSTTRDGVGASVSGAGDINGDGIADLIVGATLVDANAGRGYVIFGKNTAVAGNFAARIDPSSLTGATGFVVTAAQGYALGTSVALAGDINGDGIDDLIIGATGADANGTDVGGSYVVFGRNTGTAGDFAASLSIFSLDGTDGFWIRGVSEGDNAGVSVAAAGDVNGDGVDDLIVGASLADPNGRDPVGASYVVYGKNTATAGAFAATLQLSSLNGTNGFRITGVFELDSTGRSVASAGDVNGDGVDDLIVGSTGAVVDGTRVGAAHVIFGQVNFAGTAGADVRTGGASRDSISGQGGNDILRGMAGDDLLDGGDLSDLLYGGTGADDLIGGQGGDILYGDEGADELSGGDGADKLFGGTGADLLNGGGGNDRMDGQSDIDTLNGGAGNDVLDGGLGADIMTGGADNDVYIVDDAGEQTIELAGGGYDIVRTTLSWTLAAEIEALELQAATDANGTGNAGSNNLQGNAGGNILSGLSGVDTINGNDGDDIIIGGQNNDLLRGGTGQDTFRVEHAFSGALETDQIYDFQTAEGDVMDFSALFGGTIAMVSAFTHTAGEMTLTFASGQTTVRLDIDGNGVAEYQAKINGDVTGDWSGWLL